MTIDNNIYVFTIILIFMLSRDKSNTETWQAILPHIYRQGWGIVVNDPPPPKIFETAKNLHMPLGLQLVYDLLIDLHSNNHHLNSRCCHGNEQKTPRWLPILIFEILLNIKREKNRFC